MPRKKRKTYKTTRRFGRYKTTTPRGKREYMRLYMKNRRNKQRKRKYKPRKKRGKSKKR